jgi:hypothetical protein
MRRDILAGCIGLGITALIMIFNNRPAPYRRPEYSPFLHKPELPIVTEPIHIHTASGLVHGVTAKGPSSYTIPDGAPNSSTMEELMQLPLENGGELYDYTEQDEIRAANTFVKYIRFQCTEVRDSTTVEVGGFRFLNGDVVIPHSKMQIWNPHTGDSEKYTGGAWTDGDQRSVVFCFQEPVEVDRYEIKASSKSAEFDPVQWTIEGSMNGAFWMMMDNRATAETAFSLERGAVNRYIMLDR